MTESQSLHVVAAVTLQNGKLQQVSYLGISEATILGISKANIIL